MRLAMLLALLLASGCAHVAGAGLGLPAPPAGYQPPQRPVLLPLPGECADTVALRPGESRDCVSLSMAPATAREDLAELDVYALTREALDGCYSGRVEDRASCSVMLGAREDQLRVARAAHPRWFVVGVGAGVAGAVAVALAVVLGR